MNKFTPFAREGYPFIFVSASIALLLAFSAWQLCSVALAVLTVIAFLLAGFVLYFFRNPERNPPADAQAVVAPADGTVIVVDRVPETPLGTEALKISIFMSVFNVHVNRVPYSGSVVSKCHDCGKFFDARDGRASFENERNCIILETENRLKIAFVQIAGLIARRIVSYPAIGDRLVRGERYGLIRFGSRVDVYLPIDVEPLVKIGDTTVAGETVLGLLKLSGEIDEP